MENIVKYWYKILTEVNHIKNKTVQEWLVVEKIFDNGIIKLKNNKYIKILKIIPINYNLKSDLEKEAILNSYKIFLKTCNFDIQILIQSNRVDLNSHIYQIEKNINKKQNKYLEEISKNYIKYINEINFSKKASSKNFYIILSNKLNKKNKFNNSEEIIKNDLKEKYFKVKECLSRCENFVIEMSNKKDVEKLFYSFLNTRKNLNEKS